jgi:exonuclease SbcC
VNFDRVSLRNFKCYADVDVTLDRGVTVIHGLNGSGKSSLLEACFFTLYGARALDRTLDDVVTRGAEEAETELAFSHAGSDYRLRRRVRATGERATTAECVLETPDDTIEGATDVESYVADLLRMDAEAFVNCAYVRQGEVNKLIEASPSERQDMIDALLQLGTLEAYRERAGDARLGVEDVLTGKRERLVTLEEQIAETEDADLHGRRDALRTELGEVDDEIQSYEDEREEAETTLEEAREVLDTYEERREELDEVESDVESLREQITETENEREDLADRVADLRDRVAALEDEVADLLAETDADGTDAGAVDARLAALDDEAADLTDDLQDARMQVQALTNQAENLAERADEAEERADEKRTEADEVAAAAEDAEDTVAKHRERLDDLDDEISALRDRFADAPVAPDGAEDLLAERRSELDDLRSNEQSVAADLETARQQVEEAESLLDEGKCPECGQPVEGAPHVESLAEDRERVADLEERLADVRADREAAEDAVAAAEGLADAAADLRRAEERRADVADLLDDREADAAEKRARAERLREEAADLDDEAEEKRDVAAEKRAEAETERERVSDLEDRLDAVEAERERLVEVQDLRAERADAEEEIARLQERRESLADLNDERRDRLADRRERRDELRDAVDEAAVESARDDVDRASEYLEEVEGELDALRERRDELQSELGAVRNDLERLETLRDQRDGVADTVETLEGLHEEVSELEATYGDLRADLRQQNVARLEALLNETFDLIYGNDSYSHIELSGTYELTVFQKDGERLAPDQLSGGERALFNLSLRTAIYRLLAEGIDGAAPMPPLILDEPTVFLDSGHVSRLVDLVREMRDLGVEQIVVVSHDDELVDAADDVVHVEKDPTTNRSSVERVARSLP